MPSYKILAFLAKLTSGAELVSLSWIIHVYLKLSLLPGIGSDPKKKA